MEVIGEQLPPVGFAEFVSIADDLDLPVAVGLVLCCGVFVADLKPGWSCRSQMIWTWAESDKRCLSVRRWDFDQDRSRNTRQRPSQIAQVDLFKSSSVPSGQRD